MFAVFETTALVCTVLIGALGGLVLRCYDALSPLSGPGASAGWTLGLRDDPTASDEPQRRLADHADHNQHSLPEAHPHDADGHPRGSRCVLPAYSPFLTTAHCDLNQVGFAARHDPPLAGPRCALPFFFPLFFGEHATSPSTQLPLCVPALVCCLALRFSTGPHTCRADRCLWRHGRRRGLAEPVPTKLQARFTMVSE